MFSGNDKISIRQMQVILILTMFSSVSLTLPRTAAEFAGQDGWMLIIGGTVLMILYAYLITTLGKMFPGKTIVDYSAEILTKPIGYLIVVVFIIKLVVFLGLELRVFGELVKQTLLNNTPIEYIIIIFMFTLVYFTRKGYECRGRMGEVLIFLILVPILMVLFFAIKDVKLENMAPIFALTSKDFLMGSYYISITTVGLEFLLITMAFMRSNKGVTKATLQAVVFFMFIGLVINFVTVGIFGPKNTERLIWPVMTIMQVIELPGAFIERQDALMMSFWILAMVILISAYLFYASVLVSQLFKTKENKWINLLVLPFAYFIALGPDNVPDAYAVMMRFTRMTGFYFVLPVPVLLLVVAKIRKLGVNNEKKTE